MELILENIRCFAGKHTIPVKPITLLTGENSSGKSTLLACLAAVSGNGFPIRPRFNDSPYSLGNFDTIATYKGGRYGRAKSFSLGFSGANYPRQPSDVSATYVSRNGVPELSKLIIVSEQIEVQFTLTRNSSRLTIETDITRWQQEPRKDKRKYEVEGERLDANDLRLAFLRSNIRRGQEPDDEALSYLGLLLVRMMSDIGSRTTSIAPIRTKPKRTYDEITEEFTPEGEHIPFVLSNLLDDPSAKKTLEQFGVAAGLFNRVAVRRLGNKISDPVQVLVTNTSRPANLLDVGYGVSQALPVVVESLLASSGKLLLLQQPEVHLHPKAQAALGSLLVGLYAESSKNFVVETHSDYIIDRVRQEVAKGQVKPDDVQILYCEKKGAETTVFPIAIDKRGNVVDPPPSYRDFFMEEEMNLLSRAKD